MGKGGTLMLTILVGDEMNAAMNLAVSGMRAASAGFAASAANLVHLESPGEDSPATSPGQQVVPAAGSVAFANPQSMVVASETDPAREMVNQITASLAYRANIATFKTAQQMEKTLLDALA
jgi:flagellar basal body rod protein FlgC